MFSVFCLLLFNRCDYVLRNNISDLSCEILKKAKLFQREFPLSHAQYLHVARLEMAAFITLCFIVIEYYQSKVASRHSICFCTNVQTPKILNVLYDVPSKSTESSLYPPPASHCTSAHQAVLPTVGIPTKPISFDCTSSLSLIPLYTRYLLIKISTLRCLIQNHSYDLIVITETWLTEYPPLNQTLLSG